MKREDWLFIKFKEDCADHILVPLTVDFDIKPKLGSGIYLVRWEDYVRLSNAKIADYVDPHIANSVGFVKMEKCRATFGFWKPMDDQTEEKGQPGITGGAEVEFTSAGSKEEE